MTKPTKKVVKKRAQPRMAAAGENQRRKTTPSDALTSRTTGGPTEVAAYDEMEAVALALIELAKPDLDAIGAALTEADANRFIGVAAQVYNRPLFETLPALGEGESPGAMLSNVMDRAFESIPGMRERFARMAPIRSTRFAHLRRPILGCEVTFGEDDDLSIVLELLSQQQTDMLHARIPVPVSE